MIIIVCRCHGQTDWVWEGRWEKLRVVFIFCALLSTTHLLVFGLTYWLRWAPSILVVNLAVFIAILAVFIWVLFVWIVVLWVDILARWPLVGHTELFANRQDIKDVGSDFILATLAAVQEQFLKWMGWGCSYLIVKADNACTTAIIIIDDARMAPKHGRLGSSCLILAAILHHSSRSQHLTWIISGGALQYLLSSLDIVGACLGLPSTTAVLRGDHTWLLLDRQHLIIKLDLLFVLK